MSLGSLESLESLNSLKSLETLGTLRSLSSFIIAERERILAHIKIGCKFTTIFAYTQEINENIV